MYLTNRFHFCVRLITDDVSACEEQKSTHETQSSAVTFCSSHAMASSVIDYSTEAQKKRNLFVLYYNKSGKNHAKTRKIN